MASYHSSYSPPSASRVRSAATPFVQALGYVLAGSAGAILAMFLLPLVGLPIQTETSVQTIFDPASRVYSQASPGVVSVVDLGQPGPDAPNYALGSGFVVDHSGHLLTCHHVIEGVDKPGVVLADGSIYAADLVGDDPADDLAILRAPIPDPKLHPLRLGDSSTLQVGQVVIAIGSPFGLGQSLTWGHVSFVGRQASLPNHKVIEDAIQTDAALNPGNSGGPLLDASGAVIGVNTSATAKQIGNGQYGSIGVGFAHSSREVSRLLPEMIAGKLQTRPWLGITAVDLGARGSDGADAEHATLLEPAGARVVLVLPGSPAEEARLRGSTLSSHRGAASPDSTSDVIVAIDGVRVTCAGDLASYLAQPGKRVGDVVTLEVLREGKVLEVPLRLRARDDRQADSAGAM